jgi:uncharacterized protein YqeY
MRILTLKRKTTMTEVAEKTLHDTIKDDIEAAFRAGDKQRTNSLKTLLGDAVTAARKEVIRPPTDLEIIGFLRKFIANAKVRAEAFGSQGREADVTREREEITLLTSYLPPEISADDVRAFLADLKASGSIPEGPKGLGDAIKALKGKYGDSFDGAAMTPIAKSVVAG